MVDAAGVHLVLELCPQGRVLLGGEEEGGGIAASGQSGPAGRRQTGDTDDTDRAEPLEEQRHQDTEGPQGDQGAPLSPTSPFSLNIFPYSSQCLGLRVGARFLSVPTDHTGLQGSHLLSRLPPPSPFE